MKTVVTFLCLTLFSSCAVSASLLCEGSERTEYRHKGTQPYSKEKSATLTFELENSKLENFPSCESDKTFIRCNTCQFLHQSFEDCLRYQSGDGQRMRWEVVLNRVSGDIKSTSILDIYSQGLWSKTVFTGRCSVAKRKF